MKTISYTAARSHLAETMNKVCEDHAPIVITRAKADPVIMISLADFESMQETYYLMSNPANARRLADAIDEIEKMISDDKDNKWK